MKKLLKDFLAASLILCIILSVSGCAAPEKKTASFEELSRNGAVSRGIKDRIIYGSLDNLLTKVKGAGSDGAVVSGRVLSVRYYYCYYATLVDAYTACEIQITSIPDAWNTAGFSVGDIVRTYSNYAPLYYKDGEIDYDRFFALFGEEKGIDITCREDFEGLDEFEFEFIPEEGENYIFVLEDDTLPFEVGKEYAFFLSRYYPTRQGFDSVYGTEIVYPLDGSETLEAQCEKYGVMLDPDYLKLANDLKKLFTDA